MSKIYIAHASQPVPIAMSEPIKPLSLRETALQVAISQIGQLERAQRDNRGVMVDKYLKDVGLNPGYAWCQAFVYWCYDEAAEKLHVANPVVKTAGVLDCWNRTAVQYKITASEAMKHPELILPGYQFIFDYKKKGQGHTGIIDYVKDGYMYTMEGNTGDVGEREGYGVFRKKRSLKDSLLKGIIKY